MTRNGFIQSIYCDLENWFFVFPTLYHDYIKLRYINIIWRYTIFYQSIMINHEQNILVGGFNPLKNISQIGSSSQLLGKIENVPNHQPVIYYMTNMNQSYSMADFLTIHGHSTGKNHHVKNANCHNSNHRKSWNM